MTIDSERPPRRGGALDVLAIAVAAGVVAGLIHWAELQFARHVLHHLVWFSRDFVWMSPIVYTLLLLPLAGIFAILATVVARPWVVSLAAFFLFWVATFGVLLPYSEVARIASLVLAAGIAIQLARWLHAAPDRWLPRYRLFASAGAILVVAMALVLPRWRAHTADSALSAIPVSAAPEPPPNVLLIILDTVRAASMSLYGASVPSTPRLDAWARDAVVFDEAYSTAPWTLPSHASLFTGRYAGEVTADWKTPLDRADSTLAEQFRARGYATGAFMANMHYTAWDSGLERGFIAFDDYRRSWAQLVRSSSWTQTRMYDELLGASSLQDVLQALLHPNLSIDMKHTFDRKYARQVSRQFLDWQAGLGQRPFFAVLNYFDAHQPYYSPRQFQQRVRDNEGMSGYAAAIAYLDTSIDSVLIELQRRNTLDNTLVIVTSDHGELFDEHGLTGHAHNLYRNVLRVPLMIRFPPAVPQGTRIAKAISLRDVAATIVDLTDLSQAAVPGTSLRVTWTDSASRTSPVLAEVSRAPNVDLSYPTAKGPMKALLDDSTHYIRNGDGTEELYRYREDAFEARNLESHSSGSSLPWRALVDSFLAVRQRRDGR
ncbi:MAG: hypothetical protein MNPFHGCM_00048 [Gemmatimonadaceae bacterium]|nr:hypothetical protein [Gemmatimonadaceae bacterium]